MKGTTIAPGVRRDAYGIQARAEWRGTTKYARFAVDANLADIQAWQRRARKTLQASDALDVPTFTGGASRATLEADLQRFLAQIAGRVSFKADRSHLRAWLPVITRYPTRPLGTMSRDEITTEDINLALAQWRKKPSPHAVRCIHVTAYGRNGEVIDSYDRKTPATSGQVVAIRTMRHRCRLLMELYRTLDGAQAPTPVDEAMVPALSEAPTLPIGVPIDTVRQVAVALAKGDEKTYARFAVLATTGQRPCQVMRAQPGDVNLEVGLWVVRSAKGAPAHTITLNTEMVAAWRTFVAVAAWGPYDTTAYGRAVHAAGWPRGIRPYNARHSVMIDALEAGVDLGDVQGLAGHTTPLTTRTFYGPLAVPRQRIASDKLMGRFAGVFGPRLAAGGDAGPPRTTPRSTPRRTGKR
jgi:integrase